MVIAGNVEGHRARYDRLVNGRPDQDAAFKQYVGGGDALSIGFFEREFLVRHAQLDGSDVIDVGCGIGRLTRYLPETGLRSYLGTDIIPEVLSVAEKSVQDPRFHFALISKIEIPGPAASADIVCAFSVITHLLDEQVFTYFQETRRVLRAGGVAVFSFFDFSLPDHWHKFMTFSKDPDSRSDILKFFEKSTLETFARAAGLRVLEYHDAGNPVPLSGHWSHFADDRPAPREFTFGQSILFLQAL